MLTLHLPPTGFNVNPVVRSLTKRNINLKILGQMAKTIESVVWFENMEIMCWILLISGSTFTDLYNITAKPHTKKQLYSHMSV